MRAKYSGSERPTKEVSQRAIISMVAVGVAIVAGLVTQNVLVFMGFFVVAWLITAGGIFLFHVRNASGKGEGYSESEGTIQSIPAVERSRTERLTELKQLREQDLIGEDDYKARKAEILAEL